MLKIKHFIIFALFGCIIPISAHAEIQIYEFYAGDDPCGIPYTVISIMMMQQVNILTLL